MISEVFPSFKKIDKASKYLIQVLNYFKISTKHFTTILFSEYSSFKTVFLLIGKNYI